MTARGEDGCTDAGWLFDDALYRERYPDLTDVALKATGVGSLYEHYLWFGDLEGRSGSLFFDPACYLAELSPGDASQAALEGTCTHFLHNAVAGKGTVRTSVYFDPTAYLTRYPQVAAEIADGKWLCPLHHYLANDAPTEFDPLPYFSEHNYLARYPQIAAAIRAGNYRNGYHHFLRHGVFELRAPSEQIDLGSYVETYESVADDIALGRVRDPFAHYLAFGPPAGLGVCPPSASLRARVMLPVFARRKLDFTCTEPAALSVAMVTRDNFATAILSLGALRATYRGAIELLLVDAGSRDDTQLIECFVIGAKLLRLSSDPGPLRAVNEVLTWATAPVILVLDDHIEPAPCAVEAALDRLGSDATIGGVGGRVIDAEGRLCIGGDDNAERRSYLAPETSFVRDVDFCSELFLLVRATLFNELSGFDEAAEKGGAADLCRRIIEAGYRIIYDPAIVAFDYAPDRRANAPRPVASHVAGVARAQRRRILFIDNTVPLRMTGSGFVRSNDLIAVMASLGFSVTVFPLDPPPFGPAAIAADLPDVVEVMYDRTWAELEAFLKERADSFDAIWIARTHNLDRVPAALEAGLACQERQPMLVLDTEAIAAPRLAGEAALHGRDFDLERALATEFRNAHLCQRLVAVSDAEAATLRGLGFDAVSVIGHLCEARPTPRPFSARAGLLFLGAIHEEGSPNFDGLCWFIDTVLPLIERELGWQTRLTVAGFLGPGVSLDRYRYHPRVTLRGAVAETSVLYDSHRVFVAPTRYAAGLPYKVHEAASRGLPVVATDLLRAQLGWTNGEDLLAVDPADAARFAQCVVRLYRDAVLWQRLRDGALTRIREEHGRERYAQAVLEVFAGVRSE